MAQFSAAPGNFEPIRGFGVLTAESNSGIRLVAADNRGI